MNKITNETFKGCRDMYQNETLTLLRSYGPLFWSWGASQFTAIGKKALKFHVNGHHHVGWVYICVNGADLYDVYLTNRLGNIKEKLEDLYFDQLFDAIDKKIEFIEAYKK